MTKQHAFTGLIHRGRQRRLAPDRLDKIPKMIQIHIPRGRSRVFWIRNHFRSHFLYQLIVLIEDLIVPATQVHQTSLVAIDHEAPIASFPKKADDYRSCLPN